MIKVLILGGGQQGRVIADWLNQTDRYAVTVADRSAHARVETEHSHRTSDFVELDVTNQKALIELAERHDAIIGALPSRFAFSTLKTLICLGKPIVDVSFAAEDLSILKDEAQKYHTCLVCDFGLAPGISNLIAGHLAMQNPDFIEIQVGGFALDKNAPYGYAVTWSLEDLLEEYTRPARYVESGKHLTGQALSQRHLVNIPVQDAERSFEQTLTLEAFLTDGLRSVSRLNVPSMKEETLRWPGHIEAVKPLIESGTLIQTLDASCRKIQDCVVLRVASNKAEYTLFVKGQKDRTAMAKTTAETTAVLFDWLMKTQIQPGVYYPEDLSQNYFEVIIQALEKNGLKFCETQAFKKL